MAPAASVPRRRACGAVAAPDGRPPRCCQCDVDVAALIDGNDPFVERRRIERGTIGPIDRVVAVYSYAEVPGQQLTDAERVGFYGRS